MEFFCWLAILKIVRSENEDEPSIALAEDEVGEVWINSPSKAYGYWRGDDLTDREVIDLALHFLSVSFSAIYCIFEPPQRWDSRDCSDLSTHWSDANDLFWFNPGDLGFFHDGELFICGRVKDLIILRGRNIYPQVQFVQKCTNFSNRILNHPAKHQWPN